MTGELPKEQVDHINGIKDDNRWINLRGATNGENQQNRKNQKNKSGYRGVHPIGNRWQTLIRVNKKLIHIGCFETPKEAHIAYLEAKAKYHEFNPTIRS
jgi:hypothetical protein